jgi:hypothetical protein
VSPPKIKVGRDERFRAAKRPSESTKNEGAEKGEELSKNDCKLESKNDDKNCRDRNRK